MQLAEHPLCQDCEDRGLVVEATQVDHMVAKAKGGQDEMGNLRSLCASCHSRKTARQDGGFGHKPTEEP
jgi:5-methylcytosine-specific restriction protein A